MEKDVDQAGHARVAVGIKGRWEGSGDGRQGGMRDCGRQAAAHQKNNENPVRAEPLARLIIFHVPEESFLKRRIKLYKYSTWIAVSKTKDRSTL